MNEFQTSFNTFHPFEQVLDRLEHNWHIWTSWNAFEHIPKHLNKFWTSLNAFEQVWTHLKESWTSLNMFEHIWTWNEGIDQKFCFVCVKYALEYIRVYGGHCFWPWNSYFYPLIWPKLTFVFQNIPMAEVHVLGNIPKKNLFCWCFP